MYNTQINKVWESACVHNGRSASKVLANIYIAVWLALNKSSVDLSGNNERHILNLTVFFSLLSLTISLVLFFVFGAFIGSCA